MKTKNIRNILGFLFMAMTLMLLASCFDAKELEGTWKGSMDKEDEAGKIDGDDYYKFTLAKDESSSGDYIEMIDTRLETEGSEDASATKSHYYTYIRGTWEADGAGNLFLKPDLSSLKVKIDTKSLRFNVDGKWVPLSDIDDDLRAGGSSKEELESILRKNLKDGFKESQEELLKDVESGDKGYTDLTIEGNKMSFITGDGVSKFTKDKADIDDLFESASGTVE